MQNDDDRDITKRIHDVVQKLTNWSKMRFRRAYYHIKELKMHLVALQNNQMNMENMRKIVEIQKKINELWKQEES